MKNVLTTGSQFSGYGSYLFALQSLGVDYKSKFCCDIDKFVKQTYLANHETENYFTDATAVDWAKAPYVDLFVSSPPCQSFSIAGKRKGEADSRGLLFSHTYEYIKSKRPRVFIIENVTGLLSIDNGGVFDSWVKHLGISNNGNYLQYGLFEKRVLDTAGYYLRTLKLNSKKVGHPAPLPQNRDRVFIVGFRDLEDYRKFKAPKEQKLKLSLQDILDIRVEDKYFLSAAMTAELDKKANDKSVGYSPSISPKISTCITANYFKLPQSSTYISQAGSIRKLTPNECRKLMGLPNNFKSPCSDSQKYKQFGNSIVVNVLAAIFKGIDFVK